MSNTSRKLSSDEVSALMEGLQSGEITANSGVNTDVEVTDFAFGSDNLELLGDYYALRLINERFARFSRSVFQPMLRIQPRISSFPPEVKSFDEYSSSLDSFMSLSTYRIEELRGSLLLVMSPPFISILADSYDEWNQVPSTLNISSIEASTSTNLYAYLIISSFIK